ncbi:MAG: hypothetical protein ACTH8J_16870, partial [Specibacter sp.]
MTSNNFIKAGLGAVLAFGLAVAPLAISPAMATDEPATADPTAAAATTTESPTAAAESTTAELAPTGALPAAVTQAGTLASPNVIINEAYLNGGSANASYKNKFVELYNPTDADI